MSRNFKVLGLALVAVMALTAVMAPAASAATYTSNKPHTILSGSQSSTHVFKASGGFAGVSCKTASFAGTAESEAASIQSVVPTYSECTDTLGRKVHTHIKNAEYHFNAGVVEVTGEITLTITNGSGTVVCTDVVGAQSGVNGITYKNLGGTSGVEVITASTNVKNTTSGGLLNCGVANGLHENGSYEGKTVIKGVGTDGLAATISVD